MLIDIKSATYIRPIPLSLKARDDVIPILYSREGHSSIDLFYIWAFYFQLSVEKRKKYLLLSAMRVINLNNSKLVYWKLQNMTGIRIICLS